VSLYVSETKRLRSSSGHGVGWRTGVDFQDAGSFTHNVKFLSCPWGRDPWGTRRVCELSVFLPTSLYVLRLSVGSGLFTNYLFD
jgi:hypothetical protein